MAALLQHTCAYELLRLMFLILKVHPSPAFPIIFEDDIYRSINNLLNVLTNTDTEKDEKQCKSKNNICQTFLCRFILDADLLTQSR